MIALQNFIFPEPEICTEMPLYAHVAGPVGFSTSERHFWLGQGGVLSFDSYFNLFNLEKWAGACVLDGLWAEVSGQGRVEIRVWQALDQQSWNIIHGEMAVLAKDSPYRIDLAAALAAGRKGLLFVEIRGLDPDGATITGGRFATGGVPGELPRLAVSITTFKREAQVRETVARLTDFLDRFEFGDRLHVQVVDNGQSAEIAESDRVSVIENANYGGAGGFARGLLEAEAKGFSHCLFMDDDASFHMENIARAYLFLALARDPKTAVAAAMINNTHKWEMWENGAWFDGMCRPLYRGTDLRERDEVVEMEFDQARGGQPATIYGGWWFFAFAIAEVRHHPFPFFVRGDDISFSLMNDFRIYTINGVVSFQDDFSEKESAQTLYLDLRNHLIHHLVCEDIGRSPLGTAKVAIHFTMRSLLRLHYETARVQLLSWQDVMEGPGFFDANIDMADRRATIKEMTENEVWAPVKPEQLTERRRLRNWRRRPLELLGIFTLNGHLVPFSARRWDRIVLNITHRGNVFHAFGAARITYLNTAQDKGYTVRQSKRAFFAIGWQMTKILLRFLREHDRIKAAYREGYEEMTTPDYWRRKLG